MSYWVYMKTKFGETCIVDRHSEGGTRVVGGTTNAEMDITYNYTEYFHRALDKGNGIRWLYGRTGEECIARLEEAVKELGVKRSDDYWQATSGNAGYALSILLGWAKMHPKGIFGGD